MSQNCSNNASCTYGLVVGGDDALAQLEDETSVCTDLVVRERDPLVNESLLLNVGGKKGGVGC